MANKKRKRDWLESWIPTKPEASSDQDKQQEVILQPALRQIGITNCPICKREVAVFLTKNSRPFINCSFCSARIFYNGRESMRRLKRKMVPVKDE